MIDLMSGAEVSLDASNSAFAKAVGLVSSISPICTRRSHAVTAVIVVNSFCVDMDSVF